MADYWSDIPCRQGVPPLNAIVQDCEIWLKKLETSISCMAWSTFRCLELVRRDSRV